ncbi:hypothetical protein DPMN_194612 [Dreissena polymorpha]|uniref:Uncharacterized protein n=1 Tax=Dreissena polymorpha TaxID=45954 RepID=A0A9D4BF71_DREPO|nr:hypothetical protein DPMN_194612 [Dreissena polymorpha]
MKHSNNKKRKQRNSSDNGQNNSNNSNNSKVHKQRGPSGSSSTESTPVSDLLNWTNSVLYGDQLSDSVFVPVDAKVVSQKWWTVAIPNLRIGTLWRL